MIKKFCDNKNIENLYHFTRVDNLESILKYGILPIETMREEGINYKSNDLSRFDGALNATSVSIGFPNYKLFYRFRTNEYPNSNWCVLELKRKILWKKKCRYCSENAASSSQKKNREADFNDLSKLKAMFPADRLFLSQFSKLPSFYTSNPQAEVLVYEPIETDYIKRIVFDNSKLEKRYSNKGIYSDYKFDLDKSLFAPRSDWKEW